MRHADHDISVLIAFHTTVGWIRVWGQVACLVMMIQDITIHILSQAYGPTRLEPVQVYAVTTAAVHRGVRN